jgi:hypothetical protein
MSMTHEQLIEEIKHLSAEDKQVLLNEISKIVRLETESSLPRNPVSERLHGIGKPEFGTRDESQDSQRSRLSLSQRLCGILKFDGDPPNDEEVKDMIADYLIRKYS